MSNNPHKGRRSFLIKSVLGAGLFSALGTLWFKFYKRPKKMISGKIIGANASTGHMLRGKGFPIPAADETEHIDFVVVGGGVSGLTALREITKKGIDSICLLELDQQVGGNSANGKNKITAYPWGAHYLPIPDLDQKELIDFLKETGAITGFDKDGIPTYNDFYLCFDPEERLLINGYWQEGLIPDFGVPEEEKKEIKRFLSLISEFRNAKGQDGNYAFAIPLDSSSKDSLFTELDKITISEYLNKEGFKSAHLKWYINYCCRDDYGTSMEETSAWAGIHYFAARRGAATNAESNDVLTWPEGNGWLIDKLKSGVENKIKKNALVYSVSVKEDKTHIDYFDVEDKKSKRIVAAKCILCTPQFVNSRIVESIPGRENSFYEKFTYAPWMVANITIKNFSERKGMSMAWDNVIYGSPSLGYVNANHQHLNVYSDTRVLTYYLPLSDGDPVSSRKAAYVKSHEQWVNEIIQDLSKQEKNIADYIENIDVWLWGHGMIRPEPGFITGSERQEGMKPYKDLLFFAHSDLSGISIFEEAFYQGLRVAKEVMHT